MISIKRVIVTLLTVQTEENLTITESFGAFFDEIQEAVLYG